MHSFLVVALAFIAATAAMITPKGCTYNGRSRVALDMEIRQYSLGSRLGYQPNFFQSGYQTPVLGKSKKLFWVGFGYPQIRPGREEWVDLYGQKFTASNFIMVYTGYFRAQSTGIIRFNLKASTGASLQFGASNSGCNFDNFENDITKDINLQTMSDQPLHPSRPGECEQTYYVQKGMVYPVKVILFNDNGPPFIELTYSSPHTGRTTEFGKYVFWPEGAQPPIAKPKPSVKPLPSTKPVPSTKPEPESSTSAKPESSTETSKESSKTNTLTSAKPESSISVTSETQSSTKSKSSVPSTKPVPSTQPEPESSTSAKPESLTRTSKESSKTKTLTSKKPESSISATSETSSSTKSKLSTSESNKTSSTKSVEATSATATTSMGKTTQSSLSKTTSSISSSSSSISISASSSDSTETSNCEDKTEGLCTAMPTSSFPILSQSTDDGEDYSSESISETEICSSTGLSSSVMFSSSSVVSDASSSGISETSFTVSDATQTSQAPTSSLLPSLSTDDGLTAPCSTDCSSDNETNSDDTNVFSTAKTTSQSSSSSSLLHTDTKTDTISSDKVSSADISTVTERPEASTITKTIPLDPECITTYTTTDKDGNVSTDTGIILTTSGANSDDGETGKTSTIPLASLSGHTTTYLTTDENGKPSSGTGIVVTSIDKNFSSSHVSASTTIDEECDEAQETDDVSTVEDCDEVAATEVVPSNEECGDAFETDIESNDATKTQDRNTNLGTFTDDEGNFVPTTFSVQAKSTKTTTFVITISEGFVSTGTGVIVTNTGENGEEIISTAPVPTPSETAAKYTSSVAHTSLSPISHVTPWEGRGSRMSNFKWLMYVPILAFFV